MRDRVYMKKRESNYELLRIILMLLIIVGHLLLNSERFYIKIFIRLLFKIK